MSIVNRAAQAALSCLAIAMLLLVTGDNVYALEPTADPLRPPEPVIIDEARTLVRKMIENPRGPFLRIRWFCNDGTVLAPEPYACNTHGGGRQHAEYSPQRQRLAALGYHVGSIYAAMTWEEFWDTANAQQRLQELALESYLTEIADGWVLKQARSYRGRIQAEDEEAAGRLLLLRMLDQSDWLGSNFLLARETVRVVPHSGGDDLGRMIRRTAQDIAEANADFERLRIEIHTLAGVKTAARVRAWAQKRQGQPEMQDLVRQAGALANALDDLYGETGRQRRLRETLRVLDRYDATRDLVAVLKEGESLSPRLRAERIGSALQLMRTRIESGLTAEVRLRIFDLFDDLEIELRLAVDAALEDPGLRRGDLLTLCASLVKASFGSGLLSRAEADYTLREIAKIDTQGTVAVEPYLEASRALNRAVGWPVATIRYEFARPLVRYAALDERATGFVDDMLRGSPVLSLARASRLLAFDAQQAAGIERRIADRATPALMALNPGLARGRLRVLSDNDLAAGVIPDRSEIVLLTQTVAELPPVAGILTGGEGNLLSHLQLLARNLGIPNVSVSAALFADIEMMNGKDVILAVDSAGSVILAPVEKVAAETLAVISDNQRSIQPGSLVVPEPNLSQSDPLPLAKLGRSLSGRTVGPKAANLGELNRLFPGKVSPALALPFGLFNTHMKLGSPSLRERLIDTYEARRSGKIDEATLLKQLAELRDAIERIELTEDARRQIAAELRKEMGGEDGYGVFIRSDTNVEDLPGFSGAGLSETLPNVVGLEAQLAGIPRVWASVLSPRSVAWRANLMQNPERIYASVLLMKSVPAEKSGVMVTTDLVSYGPGTTVSTAWGVGGAVAGEAAETLVLLPDDEERLISEAKSPYRRNLAAGGGIVWQPAPAGAVLTADEKKQLRALVSSVLRKYKPSTDADGRKMPWDIEFGFVNGQLTLFQIRPLVEKGYRRAARVTQLLAGDKPARAPADIDMSEKLPHPDLATQ